MTAALIRKERGRWLRRPNLFEYEAYRAAFSVTVEGERAERDPDSGCTTPGGMVNAGF